MNYVIIKIEILEGNSDINLITEIEEAVSAYLASRNISARCTVMNKDFLSIYSKSTKGIARQLRQEDIIYIEKSRHKVIIHTRNGSFEIYTSLKKMEAQLNPDIFARIHQGYIVNLSEIKIMYSNEVSLNSINIKIPISRRNRKRVNQKMKKLH